MSIPLQYKSPLYPGVEALSCKNSFAFAGHIHNGHVLWLNSEGGEQYSLKGCTNILQPGSVSIIEPGIVHSNRPWNSARRHLRSLYLGEEFFLYLEKLFTGEVKGKLTLPTSVIENCKCWQLAVLLHEAIINNDDQLLLEELSISLFLQLKNLQFGEVIYCGSLDKSSDRINTIVEFMRAGCSDNLSLDRLAEIAQCTSYHLIRLFRNQVGMSPHAYLVQLRLEKAREYIDSGQGIAEAAFLAGFSDQSHLSRSFKKRYGLTPGLYSSQKLS